VCLVLAAVVTVAAAIAVVLAVPVALAVYHLGRAGPVVQVLRSSLH
jgi:hypothetical protein